jgi:hypothetical protein
MLFFYEHFSDRRTDSAQSWTGLCCGTAAPRSLGSSVKISDRRTKERSAEKDAKITKIQLPEDERLASSLKIKKFSFSLHAGFIAICEFVDKVC